MRLAFSTLGCPRWDLDEIAAAARSYGYEAVELRALGGSLDLLARPELGPREVTRTRTRLAERGVAVCCVSSGCVFHSADDAERAAMVDLAVRHCELAADLGAPLVRVFPDRIPEGETREATRDRIAAALAEVARRAPEGVRAALETHGDFARGAAAAEVVRLADHPGVAIIWDVANSLAAGDTVDGAASAVAPFLAHVHLRDARPEPGREHWLPVLAGTGRVPFGATAAALDALDYGGLVCFEWEKWWHPEIEEPEVALPDFAAAARRRMRGWV
jgi:sugar phosphate isomerase/epimerase